MAFTSSRRLGSANSTEDGLGSPNTHGASPDTSLFGTPSPESPSSQHGGSSSSVTTSAASPSSASASAPPGSSDVGLLVATATAASPVVAPQSIVSAPSRQRLRRMLPELPFFVSPTVLKEARQRMASQTRPSSLTEVLSDRWVKMRGECSPAAANSAVSKTTARDDQSARFFAALFERRHWLVVSNVLIRLHPDLNPLTTPEGLTEMFDLCTRHKLARKRRLGMSRAENVRERSEVHQSPRRGGHPILPTDGSRRIWPVWHSKMAAQQRAGPKWRNGMSRSRAI
ncbi:hypothetical protein PI125_g20010 [Phytophthora idaei]|nr:hypothetical protein PI125_g20010 [Phytophthora idaei]